MTVLDVYKYVEECNFQVRNDYKRRYKIYYNKLKRATHCHEFDTSNLIYKTKKLIDDNDKDIICNIVFKWIEGDFVPCDINLQPYVKEVHIKVLLSQALVLFSLMNTPKTITKCNVHIL